ncbi:O-antigen/teichoic acid export membrane protein [Azonexus fungiphilus]|uniref:O-antigen/teichoic acid export membrane protein n=1 Tax=Azonexus fungiphilus TaxID=146940 RepID=A0A495WKM7_9RHOO|nr:hypothetical protein [Azonexus fungiphilus]RKT60438.1 O-antigen/teichoic acid export membrane protein [Azonexus fungiphilus]
MVKTILTLIVGMLSGAFLVFANQIILAKYTEPEEFGRLLTILALLNSASPMVSLGIGSYMLEHNSKRGRGVGYLKPVAACIFNFSVVSFYFTGLIIVWVVWGDVFMVLLFLVLFPVLIMQGGVGFTLPLFQINSRFREIAYFQFLSQFGRLLSSVIGLVCLGSFLFTLVGYLLSAVLVFLLNFSFVKRIDGFDYLKARKIFSARRVVSICTGSLPFATNGLINMLQVQLPTVFVSVLFGFGAAAQFSICFSILLVVFIVPNAIYGQYLLPTLQRMQISKGSAYKKIYLSSIFLMLILGALGAFMVFYYSKPIFEYFFGAKYTLASNLITTAAALIPARYALTVLGAFLIAERKVLYKVKASVYLLSVQILMIFFSSIFWGLSELIVLLVISEYILLFVYLMKMHVLFKVKD